ncbi:hypothetical protein [Paraburkholderia sediminicola]|uniref:hypothetical protein n=1 Tax=Paraburkholderia sediminicola TaxID=458836 RepID=UPI0038B8AC42
MNNKQPISVAGRCRLLQGHLHPRWLASVIAQPEHYVERQDLDTAPPIQGLYDLFKPGPVTWVWQVEYLRFCQLTSSSSAADTRFRCDAG